MAALLDGAVSSGARAAIEAHAVRCDACRGLLADCSAALVSLPEAPAAAEVARALEVVEAAPPHARVLHLPPLARAPAPAAALSPRWVAAAAAILLIGGAVGIGFPALTSDRALEPAIVTKVTPTASTTQVASTTGRVEARIPGATGWIEVVGGATLPAGTELRALGAEASEIALSGGPALSLRRDTRAVLWPRRDGLVLALAQGAIAAGSFALAQEGAVALAQDGAVAPWAVGRRLRIETPQGVVTSDGAPFEVHVQRRRPTLVLAREGDGVACETPFGIVGLAGSEHTLLFDDRPPPRPRRSDLREGPDGDERHRASGRGRGRGRDGRGSEGRGGCRPPGGAELEKLWKDGEGPT